MKLTRFRTALVAAAALAVVLPLAGTVGPAQAATAKYGKVTFVADGDTIDVDIAGDGTSTPKRIRYIGIQAMELTTYSSYLDRVRGECWGPAATAALHHMIFNKRVRITSRYASSSSGARLQRHIAVYSGGAWRDTGAMLLDKGLVLPDLTASEYTHNRTYMQRAQRAMKRHLGMYGDISRCGSGVSTGARIGVAIKWDAPRGDNDNPNGEWIRVKNHGTSSFSIAGWWIRDAAFRNYKAHGFTFPSGTVLSPGEAVYVHPGKGTNTSSHFYFQGHAPMFANVTFNPTYMGDGAWLFDPKGNLRGSKMYPCRYAC